MADLYVRTCQECGHKQVMRPPELQVTQKWTEACCRKCRSPSLDYGSYGWKYNEQNQPVRVES